MARLLTPKEATAMIMEHRLRQSYAGKTSSQDRTQSTGPKTSRRGRPPRQRPDPQ